MSDDYPMDTDAERFRNYPPVSQPPYVPCCAREVELTAERDAAVARAEQAEGQLRDGFSRDAMRSIQVSFNEMSARASKAEARGAALEAAGDALVENAERLQKCSTDAVYGLQSAWRQARDEWCALRGES